MFVLGCNLLNTILICVIFVSSEKARGSKLSTILFGMESNIVLVQILAGMKLWLLIIGTVLVYITASNNTLWFI